MALNINGRMKVKTLRADFKKEFGLALRVYDGRSFADNNATLASIRKGDNKGGEFSPKRNTKVGNLEDKIMEMFGIKTQVAGSDDSYLCNDDLTLASALDVDEKKMLKKDNKKSKEKSAVKAEGYMSMEDIISEIKSIYSGHDDLEEMVTDLEGDDYHDHWAGQLVTETFDKNIKLAKALYLLSEEKADHFQDYISLAGKIKDKDGLNDEAWAIKLFDVALKKAKSASDNNILVSSIKNLGNFNNSTWVSNFLENISGSSEGESEDESEYELAARKALSKSFGGDEKDVDLEAYSELDIVQAICETDGDKEAAQEYLLEAIYEVREGQYVSIFYFIKECLGDTDWAQEWKNDYWDDMLTDVEEYGYEILDEDHD